MFKQEERKSQSVKDKEKKKSEICRYLWYNEYYADQQNRLQKERLQVYLKHLNKEKINKLVKFHQETQSILDEQKKIFSTTGRIRDNYNSIAKSRNHSAFENFITLHSVGSKKQPLDTEELQNKFQNSVKIHKFKPIEKPASKPVLKKICTDSESSSDDEFEEADDFDDDDDDYDQHSAFFSTKKSMLNIQDGLNKTNSKSVNLKKNRDSSPSKLNHTSSHNVSIIRTKSGLVKPNESNVLIKRSQSAYHKQPLVESPKRPSTGSQKKKNFAEIPNYNSESIQSQYHYYSKLKDEFAALKPEKIILKIKMNRDPIFAKRYKQFNALKRFGRAPEYDERDSHVSPLKLTTKQIEKEREKIVNDFGTKSEQINQKKIDNKFLKQKIDNFLKSLSNYK